MNIRFLRSFPLGVAIIASGAVCCCLGCYRTKQTVPQEPKGQPPQPSRPHTTKVVVNTNNQGPIRYQWTSTNGPDGTKTFRFSPSQ